MERVVVRDGMRSVASSFAAAEILLGATVAALVVASSGIGSDTIAFAAVIGGGLVALGLYQLLLLRRHRVVAINDGRLIAASGPVRVPRAPKPVFRGLLSKSEVATNDVVGLRQKANSRLGRILVAELADGSSLPLLAVSWEWFGEAKARQSLDSAQAELNDAIIPRTADRDGASEAHPRLPRGHYEPS